MRGKTTFSQRLDCITLIVEIRSKIDVDDEPIIVASPPSNVNEFVGFAHSAMDRISDENPSSDLTSIVSLPRLASAAHETPSS